MTIATLFNQEKKGGGRGIWWEILLIGRGKNKKKKRKKRKELIHAQNFLYVKKKKPSKQAINWLQIFLNSMISILKQGKIAALK
jgi:hypothetical protein